MAYQYLNHVSNSQRGAALLVSLILLLVMTLVGVATMNRARQQISMSGLMQQEEVALRRAERGLLEAEERLDVLADKPGIQVGAAGESFYITADELEARKNDWVGLDSIVSDTGDAYISEYLGSMVVPGETLAEETGAPIPGGLIYVTRTYVRATSEGRSTRFIESLYSTLAAP